MLNLHSCVTFPSLLRNSYSPNTVSNDALLVVLLRRLHHFTSRQNDLHVRIAAFMHQQNSRQTSVNTITAARPQSSYPRLLKLFKFDHILYSYTVYPGDV